MVTTISPKRLKELLDGGEAFELVDTRPEESYESWHVRGANHFPFGPEEDLEADGQLDALYDVVGETDRVVTICAKGISSGNLATQLADQEPPFEVQAVDAGMRGWSGVYDRVPVDVDGIEVVQLQRRAKGCLGYVIGCAETGAAVVVDPTEDTDEFEAAAAEAGLTIEGVIDTHVHADHVSGGFALADALDVPYYLGAGAADRDVECEFEPLSDGDVLEIGELEVEALETPGHTSDMLTLLVDDRAMCTADTLHAHSVGRTELEFSEDEGEAGARMLYESLHERILTQPDDVTILPGHVTVTAEGAFEGGTPGEPIVTTVGEARVEIDVLGLDEEAFVDRLADAGEKPANFEEIIEINRGVRDLDPEERTELELGPNNCSA